MGFSDLKARLRDQVEDLRSDMSNLKVRPQRQGRAELLDLGRFHIEPECVV